MATIKFFLPTIPRGQARPRHATINGHHRTYKTKEQELDEQTLAALMLPHRPEVPILGPVSLSIMVVMPIPASKSKKWQQAARDGLVLPTGRPDLSNATKNLEDVMQSMRFFNNDSQICVLDVYKTYGDAPGYHVELREL